MNSMVLKKRNCWDITLAGESFSLIHYSFSCITSAMPAILCFFHTHYGYYTIANLFDRYKNPAVSFILTLAYNL